MYCLYVTFSANAAKCPLSGGHILPITFSYSCVTISRDKRPIYVHSTTRIGVLSGHHYTVHLHTYTSTYTVHVHLYISHLETDKMPLARDVISSSQTLKTPLKIKINIWANSPCLLKSWIRVHVGRNEANTDHISKCLSAKMLKSASDNPCRFQVIILSTVHITTSWRTWTWHVVEVGLNNSRYIVVRRGAGANGLTRRWDIARKQSDQMPLGLQSALVRVSSVSSRSLNRYSNYIG